MKLKKRIMLVVSMAIMTLSVFLSDMQVKAATVSAEHYVNSATTNGYWTGGAIQIKADGEHIYDVSDGGTFSYEDVDNNTFTYTFRFPIQFGKYYSGKSYITLNENTKALLWDLSGKIQSRYTVGVQGDTATNYMKIQMTMDEVNMILYNKSYPLKILTNNTVYSPNDSGATTSTYGGYLYCDSVPEMRLFSDSYVMIEIKYMVSWSVSTYYDQVYEFRPYTSFNFDYFRLYELYGDELQVLKAILDSLEDLEILTDQNQSLMQTYYPKLNQMLILLQNSVAPDLQDLLYYTEVILDEFERANISLDVNNSELVKLNARMVNIHEELISLHNTLIEQSTSDKNATDGFKQDSDSQSSQLNNLNQQSQPDKIDVDNASGVVDQNLNINTDANYGVLLSTFTSNGKILTMLLAVSSIGLISYVLFGKR